MTVWSVADTPTQAFVDVRPSKPLQPPTYTAIAAVNPNRPLQLSTQTDPNSHSQTQTAPYKPLQLSTQIGVCVSQMPRSSCALTHSKAICPATSSNAWLLCGLDDRPRFVGEEDCKEGKQAKAFR